jgi:hypothetical protein
LLRQIHGIKFGATGFGGVWVLGFRFKERGPAPPVFGNKSITGTFVDPTAAGMEGLIFNGFFGGMAFDQATAIGPALLATEGNGLAINKKRWWPLQSGRALLAERRDRLQSTGNWG